MPWPVERTLTVVYGTLRDPGLIDALFPEKAEGSVLREVNPPHADWNAELAKLSALEIGFFPVTIPGFQALALKSTPDNPRKYPGLFSSPGDVVEGLVYLLTEEQATRLDYWETTDPPEYMSQQIWVQDRHGNTHAVRAYLPNDFGKTLNTGVKWDLATFLGNQAGEDPPHPNRKSARDAVLASLGSGELHAIKLHEEPDGHAAAGPLEELSPSP